MSTDEQAVNTPPDIASPQQIHGTCVAVGKACAILIGASGSGKSSVALEMIGLGAQLIADDQVILTRNAKGAIASGPPGFEGQIEARGIGILQAPHCTGAQVALVVDMDQTELHRLPPNRSHPVFEAQVPLIHGRDNPSLAPSLMLFLQNGRVA